MQGGGGDEKGRIIREREMKGRRRGRRREGREGKEKGKERETFKMVVGPGWLGSVDRALA